MHLTAWLTARKGKLPAPHIVFFHPITSSYLPETADYCSIYNCFLCTLVNPDKRGIPSPGLHIFIFHNLMNKEMETAHVIKICLYKQSLQVVYKDIFPLFIFVCRRITHLLTCVSVILLGKL